MSESLGSPNRDPETHDRPLSGTVMADSDQSAALSEVTNATTSAETVKRPNASFSIWPPSDRTREAVRNRLIETLSAPSILSKRYGTISHEEAVEAAKVIEDEAFEVAGNAATADGDGIEVLQVYSKEISKRMLEKVKARSGESETAPRAMLGNETPSKPEDDEASSAPPPSEKTESVAGDE